MWNLIPIAVGSICAAVVLVQDLKSRSIHLVPVLLLWAGGIVFRYLADWSFEWKELLINYGFVAGVVAFTALIFYLRNKENILDTKLGWGDILILFAIASWLDVKGYLLFYLLGIGITVVVSIVLIIAGRIKRTTPIPLAGILAGFALLFIPVYTFIRFSDLHIPLL